MTDYKPTFDDVETQWPPKPQESPAADEDKAALIVQSHAALREWAYDYFGDDHEAEDLERMLLKSGVVQVADLERVKREAGAAALREFANWWDAPDTIREFHMPSTRARSMADRLEKGE